jgi:hypothetical protein
MTKNAPERIQHLERLPSKPLNWDPIINAIRPECRGPYLERAKVAAEAGLYDAAVLYFWNESMNDLRRKVMSYGIEYFPYQQGRHITGEDSLRENVNDYELIEGCYQLGIISKEAWFFLQQCREIRNQYTAAHLSDSQIDPLEAQNFIKNCVKYVLTHELPSPGFSIRNFMERLRNADVSQMLGEIEAGIKDQASEIRKALLNRLFDEYIDTACSSMLRSNIELVAPLVWEKVDDEGKLELGQRYVRVRVGPSQDAALLAFNFFKVVGGISAIPDAYRRPIFENYAKALITAHFEANNFRKEGPRAEDLLELRFDVPKDAAQVYTKAVILSFLGNTYGHCWKADETNRTMLSHFNIHCVGATIKLLDTDRDVQQTLTSKLPIQRLKELVKILLDHPVLPAHEKRLFFFRDTPEKRIKDHFLGKLLSPNNEDDLPF